MIVIYPISIRKCQYCHEGAIKNVQGFVRHFFKMVYFYINMKIICY